MIGILGLHGSASQPDSISEFTARLAQGRPHYCPRGTIADGVGFTFFRRRADRSIPGPELLELAMQSLAPGGVVAAGGLREILLVGYSSGAIFGSALLSAAPELFVGAILLRPQPIASDFVFPGLSGKPILVISGAYDSRRDPRHAAHIVGQLAAAQAKVVHHALDTGHGWAPDDRDFVLSRRWMEAHFPT